MGTERNAPPLNVSNERNGDGPHPVPPCTGSSRFVSCRPRGLVWLCVASCGLSFPFLTCQAGNGNGNGKAKERSTGTETETEQATAESRTEQRNAGSTGTKPERTNGTRERNEGRTETEAGKEGMAHYLLFPSFLPIFPFSVPFPFAYARQLKLFFRSYAIVRPLFTKLEKINL